MLLYLVVVLKSDWDFSGNHFLGLFDEQKISNY